MKFSELSCQLNTHSLALVQLFCVLLLISFVSIRYAKAGDITVSWVAPAEREDGGVLSMVEIAGCRVYYGDSQGSYPYEVPIDSGSTLSVTLANLAAGTCYIAVTNVDTDGRESALSREAVINVFGYADNCTLIANPDQRDTDNGGYGNACDPDSDNSLIVDSSDLAYLKTVFLTSDPDADFNGDGIVNSADLATLKTFFFEAPGPSANAPWLSFIVGCLSEADP